MKGLKTRKMKVLTTENIYFAEELSKYFLPL